MHRRSFLRSTIAASAAGFISPRAMSRMDPPSIAENQEAVSVDELPSLEGELTLYLGRGEGGLYEDVLTAIEKRNPNLNLKIRRGPTAALANAIVAESKAGVHKADLFWAVDSGAVGLVTEAGQGQALPSNLTGQLQPAFRFSNWCPITGRIRTLPYNPDRVGLDDIPSSIMAMADSNLKVGWAPAYASFQSFVTAMRILEGEDATAAWLKAINKNAKSYAGELGVVLGVERGEVDIGFANHYYSLRLKSGKPDAELALAFSENDAGCLVNVSAVVALTQNQTAIDFIRYLLTKEVQSFLANQAYEIPLVEGVQPPEGLPNLKEIKPPKLDLTQLADLRPTLELMRKVGAL